MQDEGSTFSFKDLMTMVPLGAIILAPLFDFGSFNAVDKSLFTLFSWSDHIVFALEAVFPAIVIVAAIGWSLSRYTLDVPLKLQPHGRLWFLVVLFASLTLMVILTDGYVGVTVLGADGPDNVKCNLFQNSVGRIGRRLRTWAAVRSLCVGPCQWIFGLEHASGTIIVHGDRRRNARSRISYR